MRNQTIIQVFKISHLKKRLTQIEHMKSNNSKLPKIHIPLNYKTESSKPKHARIMKNTPKLTQNCKNLQNYLKHSKTLSEDEPKNLANFERKKKSKKWVPLRCQYFQNSKNKKFHVKSVSVSWTQKISFTYANVSMFSVKIAFVTTLHTKYKCLRKSSVQTNNAIKSWVSKQNSIRILLSK